MFLYTWNIRFLRLPVPTVGFLFRGGDGMRRPDVEVESESAVGGLPAWLKGLTFGALLLTGALWGQWGRVALLCVGLVLVLGAPLVLAQRFFSLRTRRAERLLREAQERLALRDTELERARVELTRADAQLTRADAQLTRADAQLEEVRQRAREQERLASLGTLAAGIAHEINNPMSYVKSNVSTLLEELRSQQSLPEELQEYVTDVLPATLDGIQRICAIVSDLRRFSRGEAEHGVEYDLNAEVEAALRMTRGQLQAHGGVEVELSPLPKMMGHPRQISQVIINLLVNAAQAMEGRSAGRVFLSTRQEEGMVVLTVRDSGSGMGPEVLAHLFEPFFTTKPVGQGTGMGLVMVHDIVAAHGGRIEVQSQPQQGSTFIIRLPQVPLLMAEPPSTPGASRATPVYQIASTH
jgi:signal transduction histidine kinase